MPITPLNSYDINITIKGYSLSKDRQWNKGNVLCLVHHKCFLLTSDLDHQKTIDPIQIEWMRLFVSIFYEYVAELPSGNWGFWLWIESTAGIWCPAVSKNVAVRRFGYKTSRKGLEGDIFLEWFQPTESYSLILWKLKTTCIRMRIDRVHSFSEESPGSRIAKQK